MAFDIDTTSQTQETRFKSPHKDFRLTFQEEFRLGDDAGRFYYHHSDLGVIYGGFAQWLDVGVNYRQIFERDGKSNWSRENRPHLNITLKGQMFDLDLSSRSRFEYRDRENNKDIWQYRNKVTVKLPTQPTEPKIQFYVADEVFFNFGEQGFSRNRLYSGASFTLSKDITAGVYYMWQSSKSGGSWEDINVLGTQLKFRF